MKQIDLEGNVVAEHKLKKVHRNPLCPVCNDEMILDGFQPLQLRCVDCGHICSPSWV